jgi:hypothetical protein
VPWRKPANVRARDLAAEIIKRASTGNFDGRDLLPYVVRLSEPPTAHERLLLAACRILHHPNALMPPKCLTVEEWSERYVRPDRR